MSEENVKMSGVIESVIRLLGDVSKEKGLSYISAVEKEDGTILMDYSAKRGSPLFEVAYRMEDTIPNKKIR